MGGLATAIRDATNEAARNALAGGANGPTGPGDVTFAKGAVALAAVAPGIAPVAGARVGLGDGFEGGLTYTGHAVRADARRAFPLSSAWALSLGVGGSAVLYGRGQEADAALPDVDLGGLHGWGADAPLLLGYQSDGDLYMFWIGARGGWEHVAIGDLPGEPGTTPSSLAATGVSVGGLVGLAAGFRHVHVAMEFDAGYGDVSGDYGGAHVHITGMTVGPAAAVWWLF
jgi:hypothetical protein